MEIWNHIHMKIVVVVQLLSHVQLCATPWTSACQAFLSFTISQSLLKFVSIDSMMLSNHHILCIPLFLLPSVFPSIKVFSMFSSVQSLSRVRLFVTPWIATHQASLSITNSWRLPNSCPSSRWCHPSISSSAVLFSSSPQSLPASESFPMSQLFAWGSQSIGVSALASVLPKNT